jgi:hypothetical protein
MSDIKTYKRVSLSDKVSMTQAFNDVKEGGDPVILTHHRSDWIAVVPIQWLHDLPSSDLSAARTRSSAAPQPPDNGANPYLPGSDAHSKWEFERRLLKTPRSN